MFGNNNSGIGAGIGKCLIVQHLKTCNISTNYQTTAGLTIAIPISEPAIPQITYTMDNSYFPTLINDLPESIDYSGFLLAGCSNTNASSARTLNWNVKRNGVSIGTGSQSILASNKGTLNFNSLSGVNKPVKSQADVLEIYLWCSESSSDMQLTRHCFGIIPIRIKPVNDANKLLVNVSFNCSISSISNFTSSSTNQFQNRIYLTPYVSNSNYLDIYSKTGAFMFAKEDSTYGIVTNLMDINPTNVVKIDVSNYLFGNVFIITSVKWSNTRIRYNR